jgi:hypothetical protein
MLRVARRDKFFSETSVNNYETTSAAPKKNEDLREIYFYQQCFLLWSLIFATFTALFV